MTTRVEAVRQADEILKANPDKRPSARIRYRGGRPAMNWLRKRDEQGAAALWLVASTRLPQAENDNTREPNLTQVDRRPSGKPRGANPDPRSLDAYLAMPPVKPRLGDPDPEPARTGNWDGESRGITLKPQRDVHDLHPDCRFGFCAPAIADGAIFLGAIGGLGKPKAGKQRGDVRRVEVPDKLRQPEEVDTVIEVILSGGSVADVGKALGANGGYADRRGGAALLAAGGWAKAAAANDNFGRRIAVSAKSWP